MTKGEMDQATANLQSKAEKIRVLDAHGVARAEIARYLNIRYQHVRNVLVRSAPPAPQSATRPAGALTIDEAKRGLAAHFGVPPTAIEIVIRG